MIRDNYFVSNEGQIFYDIKNNLQRKMGIDTVGYYGCILTTKSNKQKRILLHRILALAFIPNPDNKPQVNHKDENKLNNDLSNLEWSTSKENANYGTRNKRLSKMVSQNTLDGEKIKVWNSLTEIYDKTGFSKGNISTCCRGKSHQAYGYLWRYEDDEIYKTVQYTLDNEFIKVWDNAYQASCELNIDNRKICACCRGEKVTAGGFKWKYISEKFLGKISYCLWVVENYHPYKRKNEEI